MVLPFTVMDTAAVSPAIGSLLKYAVKNVAICQPSAVAGGVRARNRADFGGFDAANAVYSEPRDRCRSSGSDTPPAIGTAQYGTNRFANHGQVHRQVAMPPSGSPHWRNSRKNRQRFFWPRH